jgi:hypothetical protein
VFEGVWETLGVLDGVLLGELGGVCDGVTLILGVIDGVSDVLGVIDG